MGKYLTPDAPPPNEFICRRLRIPASAAFLSLVGGAIASLMFESAWEQEGELTPEETAQLFKRMYIDIETEYGCMVGEIKSFLRETLPPHVLPCDGSVYNRVDYPDLYSVLPASFILNADEFITPVMQRRGLMGAGESGIYPDWVLGDMIGSEAVDLFIENLPAHSHTNPPHTHTDAGHSHIYTPPGISLPVVAPGEVPATAPAVLPGNTLTGFAIISADSIIIDETGEGEEFETLDPALIIQWGIVAR